MLVLSVQRTDSVMTDIFSICVVVLIFFFHGVFWTRSSKVLYSDHQVPVDYIRDTDFLYMCKEPREEMVLVDDLFQRQFYVYVRDKYFCV